MVCNNSTYLGCEQEIFIYLVQLRSRMVCYFGFTLEELAAREMFLSAYHNRWTNPNAEPTVIRQKLRVGGCDNINQFIIYFCKEYRYAVNSLIQISQISTITIVIHEKTRYFVANRIVSRLLGYANQESK